jgi:hypothetical protein
MARFDGIPAFTGTFGSFCIYQMHGRYFMRASNPLTRDRVLQDPVFRKTMEYANLLAKASRIGSVVYSAVPANKKQHTLYRKITGAAMYWLKHNWTTEDVLDFLLKLYTVSAITVTKSATVTAKASAQPATQHPKRGTRRQHKTIPDKSSHHLYTDLNLGGP